MRVVYRAPCPPSRGKPFPKPRRFSPVRAPAPLVLLLAAVQGGTLLLLLTLTASAIMAAFDARTVGGCFCGWECLLR